MSELQDVLNGIVEGSANARRMALATIVHTEGSTYRREGARLLVPEDGEPIGTISGGCLEGDVREAAAQVMSDGRARLLHFDLTADDEVVWGWGLGCNGIVDVFVEPAEGALSAAAALREAIENQRTLATVTVVDPSERTALLPGARLLVQLDGSVEGSLGDPDLDGQARDEAGQALRSGRSGLVSLGDGVSLFVEVVSPPPRLLVCGAGHDAVPLVRLAAGLGWRVEVVDDRPAFLRADRFPQAARFVQSDPIDAAQNAGVDERTFVVVMSHNFVRDTAYLRSFLRMPVRYIGMLGPSARLDRILDQLRREGLDPDPARLAVVHGPAGLDLGGDGPEEVAMAIVAEVMALLHDRTGGSLKEREGPIHDRAPLDPATASSRED